MMMQHFECAEAEIEIDQDAGFGVKAEAPSGEIDFPSKTNFRLVREDFDSKEVQGTMCIGTGKLKPECDRGELDVDIE